MILKIADNGMKHNEFVLNLKIKWNSHKNNYIVLIDKFTNLSWILQWPDLIVGKIVYGDGTILNA